MKKVPSALKWLAEKRARLAHELEVSEKLAADIQVRLERVRIDLQSVDRTIQVFDPAINPTAIGKVAGWKGRYGKRGALKETLKKHLEAAQGTWLTTENLELLVRFDLQVEFMTPQQRNEWVANSLLRELKRLVEAGYGGLAANGSQLGHLG